MLEEELNPTSSLEINIELRKLWFQMLQPILCVCLATMKSSVLEPPDSNTSGHPTYGFSSLC